MGDEGFQEPNTREAVPVLTAEVGPGEAIFVPAGWTHAVENIEPTIALSGNFVDRSNLEKVRQQLAKEGQYCGFHGAAMLESAFEALEKTGHIKAIETAAEKAIITGELQTLLKIKEVGGETWTPTEKMALMKRTKQTCFGTAAATAAAAMALWLGT